MIPQSTFMICAAVRADKTAQLTELLESMNGEDGLVDADNGIVPFSQLSQLHFARLVIIDSRTSDDIAQHGKLPEPWPKHLVFLGDCDGSSQMFLAELAIRAGPGLKKIFSHCYGFDIENQTLSEWMIKHNKQPSANYINWIGRSVVQVHEEIALHAALKNKLASIQPRSNKKTNRETHLSLKKFVNDEISQRRLHLSEIPSTPKIWWLCNLAHKIGVPLLLLLAAPILILALPFLAIWLRILERSDPEITPRPSGETIAELSLSEDRLVTNQFSAFGDVKPGIFRRYVLVFFLFILDYAARHIYNRGYLTRVRTIHFARWVLLDDKKRVLFASNYDGDLESYMDDFINKVGWGLNLVFSNGVGWPETRWLVKDGSSHEQKFKYYLRRHQYSTNIWYKAYPDFTTVDLQRNSRIRDGLEKTHFKSDADLSEWLSLI